MQQHDDTRRYVEILEAFDEVQACALGGSHAQGLADDRSDVDLFLFLDDEGFLDAVAAFGPRFAGKADTIAHRYRGYLLDIGYQYSTVHPGPVFLDLFLNCEATLTRTPLLALNRIVFDKTGRYTELIAAAPADPGADGAVGEYLIELDLLAKFARRRDVFPFLSRLDRLRSILVALRCAVRGSRYNSYLADRQINREFGGDGLEAWLVANTLPAAGADLSAAVRTLTGGIQEALDALGLPERADPRALELIAGLREETLATCRAWDLLRP
ncbi:hypothetical protein GCM10010170_044570 [Dactylosporangium salmoneum]|uniref:Polymerase nucleotidyl transferase domain-containing protein n=1 Tax=Dactylosporangium salmoneum TaxID=53361 RepID=A0ABN3GJJ8_9ACTN